MLKRSTWDWPFWKLSYVILRICWPTMAYMDHSSNIGFFRPIKHRLKTRSSGSKSRSLDGFPLPLAIKSSNNFSGTPSLCSDKDRLCHWKVVCTKARGTKRHLGDVIHLRCSGSGMKSLAFDSSSELLVSMQHDMHVRLVPLDQSSQIRY